MAAVIVSIGYRETAERRFHGVVTVTGLDSDINIVRESADSYPSPEMAMTEAEQLAEFAVLIARSLGFTFGGTDAGEISNN